MKAIVRSKTSPRGLALADVPEPVPERDEILVAVTAASLNYGTVAYLDGVADGSVRGSDGSGIVVAAAADGSGPALGARVAFATPHGSWAERCRVPSAYAAEIPGGVQDTDAAALPGAGLTALQAVRRLGSVLNSRVLVTGAAGGVGMYAVQLLARSGATPVVWTRTVERAAGLERLGAQEFITSAEQLSGRPVDAIIDTVGGDVLAAALGHLADNGLALNIGHTSGAATPIDFEAIRRLGPGRRVEAFVCTDVSAGSLAQLLEMTRTGRLSAGVDRVVSWDEYGDAVQALFNRKVRGKAVLRIGPVNDEVS